MTQWRELVWRPRGSNLARLLYIGSRLASGSRHTTNGKSAAPATSPKPPWPYSPHQSPPPYQPDQPTLEVIDTTQALTA